MLREEKSFVLKYIKHKSKSNRFCIFIFIKLLHVQSIYSSHFVVASHVSICILNKTLFVLMLLLQIKTKNPVIFFLLLIVFSLQIYSYMQFIFTFKLQKKLFIGFFKDVVQGSKDILQCCHYKRPYQYLCVEKKGNLFHLEQICTFYCIGVLND